MRHNDVIYFLIPETREDELGQKIPTGNYNERMVYANQYSISQSEFYNASAQGLKPEKEFEIYSFEYQGEDLLRHEGTTYHIIRGSTSGEKMRITCEKDVGNG
ncbi:phage head closure protein [Tuberibacillus sp. Marseille-P3662]|uniref:phage head closure protein n=1 Tax=Tuberibacillus sp. Marseille-P3662 TaxID=1965358 RepID=UPI001593D21E|nr:phage head closure protein [Tuberibacillus sp. Marseille-P3662]